MFLFGLGERPDPSHVVFAVHILIACVAGVEGEGKGKKRARGAFYGLPRRLTFESRSSRISLHLIGSLDLSPFLSVSDLA